MLDALNAILAKPWAAIGALLVVGIILGALGLGTPGATLIGLAGLLIMYAFGTGSAAS